MNLLFLIDQHDVVVALGYKGQTIDRIAESLRPLGVWAQASIFGTRSWFVVCVPSDLTVFQPLAAHLVTPAKSDIVVAHDHNIWPESLNVKEIKPFIPRNRK